MLSTSMKRLGFAAVCVALAGSVRASEYEGEILEVAIGPSFTQTNYTRVSVRVPTAHGSPCATTGLWFAYEFPEATGSTGKSWTAVFIAAKTGQQRVKIVGTGTCDPHSVEAVASVHML